MSLVLHVVDRLSGGVPVAVRDYIRNTPPEFSHAVLSPFQAGVPSQAWSGLDVIHRDLTTARLHQVRRIRVTVDELAPSVVHAHSSFPGALSRISRIGAIQLVYSPHCFKFDDPATMPLVRAGIKWAEKALAHRSTHFAVLSAHEAKLARSVARSASTTWIPNVPSVDVRAPFSDQAPPRRIGMLGRVAPQKDPHFMAALTREIGRTVSDIESVWIGDGALPLRTELEDAGVVITGWVDSSGVVDELDRLGLYVHTASYEGFPLSVLDAAARRIPIISRRIPALEEVGIRTFDTPSEGAALAIRSFEDPAFRQELLEIGQTMLTRMSPDRQRESLRRVWSSPSGA